ncbi:hypothetical protein ABZ330_21670 [Streptomyces sp. NPDC006172]
MNRSPAPQPEPEPQFPPLDSPLANEADLDQALNDWPRADEDR